MAVGPLRHGCGRDDPSSGRLLQLDQDQEVGVRLDALVAADGADGHSACAVQVGHRKKQKQESVDLVDQPSFSGGFSITFIDVYRKTRPDWSFVRHEDLSLDPVGGSSGCSITVIDWNDHCAQTVRESSDEGNLKDAAVAGKSTH